MKLPRLSEQETKKIKALQAENVQALRASLKNKEFTVEDIMTGEVPESAKNRFKVLLSCSRALDRNGAAFPITDGQARVRQELSRVLGHFDVLTEAMGVSDNLTGENTVQALSDNGSTGVNGSMIKNNNAKGALNVKNSAIA